MGLPGGSSSLPYPAVHQRNSTVSRVWRSNCFKRLISQGLHQRPHLPSRAAPTIMRLLCRGIFYFRAAATAAVALGLNADEEFAHGLVPLRSTMPLHLHVTRRRIACLVMRPDERCSRWRVNEKHGTGAASRRRHHSIRSMRVNSAVEPSEKWIVPEASSDKARLSLPSCVIDPCESSTDQSDP